MKNFDETRRQLRELGWQRHDHTRKGVHREMWSLRMGPFRHTTSYSGACEVAGIVPTQQIVRRDPCKPNRRDKKLQCKHLGTVKILKFVSTTKMPHTDWTSLYQIQDQLFPEAPARLVLAKMRALLRNGVVEGCGCGCRGDFELTAKGAVVLMRKTS